MPELPEVETMRKYFDSAVLGQNIIDVQIHDPKIIRHPNPDEFAELLRERTFIRSERIGKYHFGLISETESVQFHYGMTGSFDYYARDADPPKHERFVIIFDNGFRMGFNCPRKFARVRHISTPLPIYLKSIDLGPDALSLSKNTFLNLLLGKKGTIKSVLMDQHIMSGLGNLYVDEICYRMRIHPASKVNEVPKSSLQELYDCMRDVLFLAIELTANYQKYPDPWPFWQWREQDQMAPDGTSRVEKITIGGRSTFVAPGWQTLYD